MNAAPSTTTIWWERQQGTAVYHAFQCYGPGHSSDIPECRSLTRRQSTQEPGWFVWTDVDPPGDLCPSCAALMNIPPPRRAKTS